MRELAGMMAVWGNGSTESERVELKIRSQFSIIPEYCINLTDPLPVCSMLLKRVGGSGGEVHDDGVSVFS